jgi:hypothetical protein
MTTDMFSMSVSQMTTDIFSMSVSQSRPSFSVHDLTPNMTCDRTFITSNTTDAASGVHPSLLVGFVLFSVHCCVVFCRPLFVLYTCSFWPLYCMSFILVLFGHYIVCPLIYHFWLFPMVSSNLSYYQCLAVNRVVYYL